MTTNELGPARSLASLPTEQPTKRELFAAMALQGLLSSALAVGPSVGPEWNGKTVGQWYAYQAVRTADYLIEELNK